MSATRRKQACRARTPPPPRATGPAQSRPSSQIRILQCGAALADTQHQLVFIKSRLLRQNPTPINGFAGLQLGFEISQAYMLWVTLDRLRN